MYTLYTFVWADILRHEIFQILQYCHLPKYIIFCTFSTNIVRHNVCIKLENIVWSGVTMTVWPWPNDVKHKQNNPDVETSVEHVNAYSPIFRTWVHRDIDFKKRGPQNNGVTLQLYSYQIQTRITIYIQYLYFISVKQTE